MNVVLKNLSFVTHGDTIRFSHHSLFRLLATFNADFALVSFRVAMLTTEISMAAVAVMTVILPRSPASHGSHWLALRAFGIAISPRLVYEFLGCPQMTWR